MSPEPDDILEHLFRLYGWTTDEVLFEIRCLHPSEHKNKTARFRPDETGFAKGASFIIEQNLMGFNVYSVVNPVRRGLTSEATDDDVVAAIYHFIDNDDTDTAVIEEKVAASFQPAFIVESGLIPRPRQHTYWRMPHPITDMSQWTVTQKGLAEHFGTDPTIHNPSRLMRIAGTVSFPPPRKVRRGYVTEQTRLLIDPDSQPVDAAAFIAAFPHTEEAKAREAATVTQPYDPDDSEVPLSVLAQAFSVIQGWDDITTWRDMGFAAKEANAGSKSIWDDWSRQSVKFEAAEQTRIWNRPPKAGGATRRKIFWAANEANRNWWRDGGEVEAWQINEARAHNGEPQIAMSIQKVLTPMEEWRRRMRYKFSKIIVKRP